MTKTHSSHYGEKAPRITTVASGGDWRIDRVSIPYVGSDYAVYISDNYIGSYPTQFDAERAREQATYEVARKAA